MLIDAEKANYPVRWMCQVLGVPRSSFYDWRIRSQQVTATVQRRAALGVLVKAVFDEFRQTYGCRRIARELNDRGYACSVGLVADLMRQQGLIAIQPRTYRVTTICDDADVYPPDLLGRHFTAQVPGTRLVGDITYLRTGEGWAYLAVVVDLATRMVVGWQIAEHMRTSLVVDALAMARDHGHLAPNAIFHSDRGTQYHAEAFVTWCADNQVTRSMGRTGVCWDNAAAESFFATLKNEMYHRYRFDTRARARFVVAEYVEMFYNRKRKHSTLGYRTPAQALADYHTDVATAA